MKSEAEVHSFFKTELYKLLLPLEEYRVSKVKRIKNKLVIGLLLLIPGIVCLSFSLGFMTFIAFFTAFIFFGLAYQDLQKMTSTLQKEFKYKVLPALMNYLFEIYEYIPNQRIAKSVFIKSRLFIEDITRVEGEDFMRFTLSDTSIMFCESEVYKFGQNYSSIFRGVFLVTTFNKSFNSQTIILDKRGTSFFQKIIRRLSGFQIIRLEDVDFSNEFIVYGTDQVNARYILTPGLMGRILDYKHKINKKIALSFIDDRMYCCIPNYINLFEPALFNSFLEFDFILKQYETLKLYTDVVEDLNLNLRIWTRSVSER